MTPRKNFSRCAFRSTRGFRNEKSNRTGNIHRKYSETMLLGQIPGSSLDPGQPFATGARKFLTWLITSTREPRIYARSSTTVRFRLEPVPQTDFSRYRDWMISDRWDESLLMREIVHRVATGIASGINWMARMKVRVWSYGVIYAFSHPPVSAAGLFSLFIRLALFLWIVRLVVEVNCQIWQWWEKVFSSCNFFSSRVNIR